MSTVLTAAIGAALPNGTLDKTQADPRPAQMSHPTESRRASAKMWSSSGADTSVAAKRAAVAALYETHFERVVRYIAFRIGNVDEAQDLASEVFVRALRSVDSFKETGAPMEAWVFKIASNITIDYFRRNGRRPAALPLDTAYSVAAPDDPTANAEAQDEANRLRKAMECLSKAQQQVLSMRFGGQMTAEEVARALGKKPSAIREMQSAAIKKLRQIMPEYESNG